MSINLHNITRPNVQADFVTKSWLFYVYDNIISDHDPTLKVCVIASDWTIIAYIINKKIFEYDLIKKEKRWEITVIKKKVN